MSDDDKPDLSTFSGRLSYFLKITDPRTLLYTDAEVLESKRVLDECKRTGVNCGTREEMKKRQLMVDSAIHPVTGEITPRLFRVSAIAPANIPIVFAMIQCPASNVVGTLFLHWFNQSYNTACNYANRSGADQSIEATAKAYGLAVASACSFAYGMGKLVEKGPPIFQRLGFVVPLIATAAANCSNIGFTRGEEITKGTPVYDEHNNLQGLSTIAGTQGVVQTAITRCVMVPASCLLLPPMAMGLLGKMKMLPNSNKLKMLLEIGIIYLSLQGALPAALAVFPQTAKFNVKDLEPQFQNLKDVNGNKVSYVYANKGL
jgi:tricarboxylate carrier